MQIAGVILIILPSGLQQKYFHQPPVAPLANMD